MEFAALYSPAHDFLRRNAGREVLIVAMERHGSDHIVRKYSGLHAGIHRYSLRQLIATMGSGVLKGLDVVSIKLAVTSPLADNQVCPGNDPNI
jgi:hypothetical protein